MAGPAPAAILQAHGRYALWCVGPDRVDDGGKRRREPVVDPVEKGWKGDWLWSYPTGVL